MSCGLGTRRPKFAPAISAFPPSLAVKKCSCIFGVPAIHGGKKKDGPKYLSISGPSRFLLRG